MAKKYYKKIYYKKGKWSPNIYTIENNSLTAERGYFFVAQELAQNPVQSQNTISQQYTVKNVELNFEINCAVEAEISSLVLYIMYAPQGISVTENFPKQHPEYIMAFRFLGKPNYQPTQSHQQIGRNAIKVKSRLSRRLQTGDRLVLLITGYNSYSESVSMKLSGIFRWWTKAN